MFVYCAKCHRKVLEDSFNMHVKFCQNVQSAVHLGKFSAAGILYKANTCKICGKEFGGNILDTHMK